ncbi:uncharacterized protein LOC143882828 [Tasmannia lanceolata]|uniref:uncharacterized protein LOC143882828 n=1 Tax=Tasmannia lanceolata TaxID=3420 RepID=UPI004062B969
MSKAREISVLLILVSMAMATWAEQIQTWPGIFPIDPQIQACWASLYTIEGCVQEIFFSFISQQLKLGPACCKAINEIGENCWPKMFLPFNPLIPPFIEDLCASGTPPVGDIVGSRLVNSEADSLARASFTLNTTTLYKPTLYSPKTQPKQEQRDKMSKAREISVLLILVSMAMATWAEQIQTWPGIFPIDPQIQACWASLYTIEGCVQEIFFSFISQQLKLGPACCKAINEIGENCWPKMFLPFNPLIPPFIEDLCASGTPPVGVEPTPA